MGCLISIITSIIVLVVFFPVVVNTFGSSPLVVLAVLLVIGGWLIDFLKTFLACLKERRKENKMISNNPGLGQRVIETSRRGVKEESACTRIIGPMPAITQDGGWEIHPALDGITFCFWKSEDQALKDYWYVTFKGRAPEAPWACYLTGWLSDSPEDDLKGFYGKRPRSWLKRQKKQSEFMKRK